MFGRALAASAIPLFIGCATLDDTVETSSDAFDSCVCAKVTPIHELLSAAFGAVSSSASFVNDSGQVVGRFRTAEFTHHGFFYSNGAVTKLPDDANAVALSASGSVLLEVAGGRTLVWDAGSTTEVRSLAPNARETYGYAINATNAVTGNFGLWINDTTESHPFLWSNGVLTDLGVPAGFYGGTGQLVNDAGMVAGSFEGPGQAGWRTAVFTWSQGVTTTFDFPGDVESVNLMGINNSGVVVGSRSSLPTDPPRPPGYGGRGFLIEDGTMSYLGDDFEPWAINDRNQIVGVSINPGATPERQVVLLENGSKRVISAANQVPSGARIDALGRIIYAATVPNEPGYYPRLFVWYEGTLSELERDAEVYAFSSTGYAAGAHHNGIGTEARVWDLSDCR